MGNPQALEQALEILRMQIKSAMLTDSSPKSLVYRANSSVMFRRRTKFYETNSVV
jgi:hypothetical protein